MKTIQITSSGFCELTENFMVTDEVFQRFNSQITLFEDLKYDEKQKALMEVYTELQEAAAQVEYIKIIQLETTPEVINEIRCFNERVF